MRERWEYIGVSWTYTTEVKGENRVWRHHISTNRAGSDLKEHQSWSSESDAIGPNLAEVLNELGAEGWELITDTIVDSTVISQVGGWNEVGTPTTRQFILKRRL